MQIVCGRCNYRFEPLGIKLETEIGKRGVRPMEEIDTLRRQQGKLIIHCPRCASDILVEPTKRGKWNV